MAYMPCDAGRHFNPVRNVNCYFAVGEGSDFERWSLRLCLGHWQSIEEDLTEFEVISDSVALSSWSPNTKCVACRKPVDQGGRQLFVTSYPAKNERKDYWAKIHPSCHLAHYFHPTEGAWV